jgi:DNA-binding NarL/FixJ family response regulator
MRQGLSAMIDKRMGMKVVGEAANGRIALQLVESLQPDVVVLDLMMPTLNGIEASRQITERWPRTRTLILTMNDDQRSVSRALEAGASGFVVKDNAFEEVVKAIETVAQGQVYLSPSVAGSVVDSYRRKKYFSRDDDTLELSSRELEVLQLLAEGHSTKETAAQLGVSPKTIESHRLRLFKKLEVTNVVQLARLAIREGIIPP